MKLLYLDLGGTGGPNPELQMRYNVVCVQSYLEAMQRILTDYFDAFVISDGIQDAGLLSFTSAVHEQDPELPTFVLSNGRSDLISAIDSILPFAPPVPFPPASTMIH